MKVDLYRRPGRSHADHTTLMDVGLRRHGLDVAPFGHAPRPNADVAIVWSWRVGTRIRNQGFTAPILVMERGYLGDRFAWTSLGWDGLNGMARFNGPQDGGERFWKHFGHLACDWERTDGYALVMGQVQGDMALVGVDFWEWVNSTFSYLRKAGIPARFRPHPEAVRRGQIQPVPRTLFAEGQSLKDALSGAAFVVCWNSNAGVDAAMAGVPVVALDAGSMAWPISSHGLSEPLVTPDRSDWFRDMAWRQWSNNELADGSAWEVAREAM